MKPWGLFGIWISEAFALALLSGCAGPRTLGPATAPAGEARAPGARMEDAPATLSLEALFRLAESRNPSLRAAAAGVVAQPEPLDPARDARTRRSSPVTDSSSPGFAAFQE